LSTTSASGVRGRFSTRGKEETLKTQYCADVAEKLLGKEVVLNGWVQIKREHGGVVFVDLRDRSGIAQLVFNERFDPRCYGQAADLKSEYVVRVRGEIRRRESPNPELPTGYFEVWVRELTVLNTSKTLPIGVVKQSGVSEELRLKYRYIDLRREEMRANILMRHRITSSVRKYLDGEGFIDIETPFLTKSTPEGARDFIVPSRQYRGKFYALPQSPQIFKQLLMVSGFEKYYQIVRCFRDEDLRADRQPEFTQVDIEASFVGEEDIYSLVDGMFMRLLADCYGQELATPVQRFEYDAVMEQYGTDRPDLRFGLKITNLHHLMECRPKELLREGRAQGKQLFGIYVPFPDKVSRKSLDGFAEQAKKEGIDLFSWLKVAQGAPSGPLAKLFEGDLTASATSLEESRDEAKGKNFLLCAAFGENPAVLQFLGKIRLDIGGSLGLADRKRLEFCWVVNFPLFEWSAEENRISSVHHPFTAPRPEDLDFLETESVKVKSRSYDFVLNGVELGGGSIRIHDKTVQDRVFSILGLTKEETMVKFGFLLEALQYGAPPHGGIAFGLDRVVMMLQGAESIRDVIPFPKTSSGACPLSGAPDRVSVRQLQELGLNPCEGTPADTGGQG
jgi:aspartyl-tRNA synthetase